MFSEEKVRSMQTHHNNNVIFIVKLKFNYRLIKKNNIFFIYMGRSPIAKLTNPSEANNLDYL